VMDWLMGSFILDTFPEHLRKPPTGTLSYMFSHRRQTEYFSV